MLGRRFYTSAAQTEAGHRTFLKRDQPSVLRLRLSERGLFHQLAVLVSDLDLAVRLFLAISDDLLFFSLRIGVLIASLKCVCRDYPREM